MRWTSRNAPTHEAGARRQRSVMAFVTWFGFGFGSSIRRNLFVTLSALTIALFFLLVARNQRIFIMSSSTESIARKYIRLWPKSSDTLDLRCATYEVYTIIDGIGNNSTLQNYADLHFLKQILNPADCFSVSAFYIHVVYYKDSAYRAKNETRKLLNDSIQRCAHDAGATVELDFIEISERKLDGLTIGMMMRDNYIFKNVDCLSIVFSSQFNRDDSQLPIVELTKTLAQHTPKNVGVVFQEGNTTQPSRIYLTRNHIEIFGFFIPRSLPELRTLAAFLRLIYPKDLITTLDKKGGLSSTATPVDAVIPSVANDLPEYNSSLQRYVTASASNPCMRCRNTTSRQVISMSLYGNDPRYTMGAIRNAQLLPVVFPGWRLWFYVEKPNPTGATKHGPVPAKLLSKLEDLGSEIVWLKNASTGPRLWRFIVMDSEEVDVFTVRDSDSRLTPRDGAVVADWLKTDRIFHCIRDHPSHSNYIVSAGLWGARRKPFLKLIGNMGTTLQKYGTGYVEDMNFLVHNVWPKVKDVAYCHDSFSCARFPSSHPFPVARIGYEHIGQVYNEHSVGRQGDINIIRAAGVNKQCVPA